MKRLSTYLPILIAFILTILSGGCTHNNGDIGPLFGQWQLQSIQSIGVHQHPALEGELYWSFQSSTIKVTQIKELHAVTESYGNYRLADETLFLEFPDTSYPLLIPGVDRTSEWEIDRLTNKELWLLLTDSEGNQTEWKFKKWS